MKALAQLSSVLITGLFCSALLAEGSHEHEHTHEHQTESSDHAHHGGHGQHASAAGRPGKASDIDRTVAVEASDTMRFILDPIETRAGETIKFVITNTGAIKHEFSIGTKGEHLEHGKMMVENPDMHHGPGGASVTILPGKTESLIWQFESAQHVEIACNMPGHYQAGMVSPVKFSQP